MGKRDRKLEDLQDYDRWTVSAYVLDVRKLHRIQMAREAQTGQRPTVSQLIHEAVREMQEP